MKSLLLSTLIVLGLGLRAQTDSLQAPPLDSLQGLIPGAKAPLLTLLNADSTAVNLNDLLQEGPLVIVFYRGHWCPYCSRYLSELSEISDSIQNLGARLLAISAEKPAYLREMQTKSGADFTFLYDENYALISAFNLAFLPSKGSRLKLKTFLGADLSEFSGAEKEWLLVPATYLIDQEGIIRWRHFDPDYTERASTESILDELHKLSAL